MAANITPTLDSWSATEASNQPDGTDTADIDAELRRIQAVIRKYTRTIGTDIAAASTIDLSAADGDYINITGAGATVTSLGTLSSGMRIWLHFEGINTITHSTNLILPGEDNILTAADDVLCFESLGGGRWRCLVYSPFNYGDTLTNLVSGNWVYDTFTGDGSDTTFTLTSAPGSMGNMDVSINGVTQQPVTHFGLTGGTTLTFTTAPANGDLILVRYGIGTVQSVTILEETYTATGGETLIELSYEYTPGSASLMVFKNTDFLIPLVDYTETDSTHITLTAAATAGHKYHFRIGSLVNSGSTITVADGSLGTNKYADDSVTLAKIAEMATDSFLGRITAGTGNPEAFKLSDLTAETTVNTAADYVLMWDASAGAHRKVLVSYIVAGATGLGYSQTWTDVKASRAKDTSYQNTTGKPISVAIDVTHGDQLATLQASANGSDWVDIGSGLSSFRSNLFCVVPNGHYYKLTETGTGGVITINKWAELR